MKGFKDFILRGNVIELAVAVVVGTAFTAIVTAFSTSVISPIIAATGGSPEFGLGFHIIKNNPATYVDIGAVITAAINFLIIAAVVYFLMILPMNKLAELPKKRHSTATPTAPEKEKPTADPQLALLEEIRDLLRDTAR